MAKTVINFKTDSKLKAEAKKVLEGMGLNFSIAFNNYLHTLIAERKVEFVAPEIPNARLKKAIKNAEKEYATGKMKFYTDMSEMRKSLGL